MSIPRRDFLLGAGATGLGGMMAKTIGPPFPASTSAHSASGFASVSEWRDHFPALRQTVNGHPLAYLDTAATSLRPQPVIDALSAFYSGPNANPGATLHSLARRAAELHDEARKTVAAFAGSNDPLEIVFTRGTTEAINLAASAWGRAHLRPGDEILLTAAEHASNMLPWQLLAESTGAVVRYASLTDDGRINLEDFRSLLSARTRIAAFSHVSNVVGIVNPVRELCAAARSANVLSLVDAAQSAPHFPIDVREIGCDFLAFSSHKMCGPMGAGALWVRRELLETMPPYQAGSNMAHDVEFGGRHYSNGALKFGAGTPNVADAIGFAAAATFLRDIGWASLRQHEQAVTRHMLAGLSGVRGLTLLGPRDAVDKIGVFAFSLDGHAPGEIVASLDNDGIAVRAGDLAALPLLRHFGMSAAVRASCYLYTTTNEVDRLIASLERMTRR